jgi:rhamnosyltransferase
MAVRCSVILLTKNGGHTLRPVLERLAPSVRRGSAEIVAIDSGSTDDTLAILARYPLVLHQIPPSEFGHGRTRNLGGRLTSGDHLVYLTQDAVPVDDDLLERLLEPFADPLVAGVYGRQLPHQTHIYEAFSLARIYPATPHRKAWAPGTPLRLNDVFFSNVCSAIRRSVWTRIPFDDDLIMSEDQQWSRDVLRAGWAIAYQPRAAVLHSHHRSLGQVFRRHFDSGASLAGLVADDTADTLAFGARFVLAEMRFLRAHGAGRRIPYLLLYEASRAAGFLLGRQQRALPRWLTRRCSEHRYHWDSGRPGAAGVPASPSP